MSNYELRKQKEAERLHILNLMKDALIEILEESEEGEGRLTDSAKFAAIQMLNEVRIELHLDHVY